MPVQERILETPSGKIHYWVSHAENSSRWLVFLPGLTADHHLFDLQMEYFTGCCNCLVWDAPEEVNRLIQDRLPGDWLH